MKILNNIYSVETLEQAYSNTMINGLPRGLEKGLNSLDELFRLERGKLVVVTGIPNMGKSEFVDYLCVQYNKKYAMRTAYFSPENQPIAYHIGKLFRKFEGPEIVGRTLRMNTVKLLEDIFTRTFSSLITLRNTLSTRF